MIQLLGEYDAAYKDDSFVFYKLYLDRKMREENCSIILLPFYIDITEVFIVYE